MLKNKTDQLNLLRQLDIFYGQWRMVSPVKAWWGWEIGPRSSSPYPDEETVYPTENVENQGILLTLKMETEL
jgi:hypothetical protein